MLKFLTEFVSGSYNERQVKRYRHVVSEINELEPQMQALTDEQLRALTGQFRERVANGESLEDLLNEAFAAVREASRRVLQMRHFDVQLIGGMVLHEGKIAEMKTGEGKTLVATLPAYLNALSGAGVHIVTVNDYLAKRDSEWMGRVFQALDLTVGLIVHDLDFEQRRQAYAADVTYGTNNEMGFDYLRDNMVIHPQEMVHRGFNFAIVDEVDSILIDEARTPLIISGPGFQSTELYYRFAQIAQHLHEGTDFHVDEKAKTVAPTEEGIAKVEKMLGVDNLYADASTDLSHYLTQALKAKALMKPDRDYVVHDGEVVIVDEFTGRLMFGRRYSDGLHQAIEAKEKVEIAQESQTLATITFQNYFRMYKKLSGMTGTAATEEEEFRKIYGLDVVIVPTHKPMVRQDLPDVVYKTEAAKFRAVVNDIVERHKTGQPVLVGTISIEKSEFLSRELERRGIEHQVLNAKHHEKEAEIIARAGQPGTVTIATNMAGRGTDIVLGPGVAELGGLHIIGTERHESRRIDNQLRGRSGRQGDPGSSRFYISLEDDLMRIFGSDNIRGLMDRMGLEEDEPIEHGLLSKGIENAQRRVESRNFDMRKHVLEYDDVMNKQREVIYEQRRRILGGENLKENILEFARIVLEATVDLYCPDGVHQEEWNRAGIIEHCEGIFLPAGRLRPEDLQEMDRVEMVDFLLELATELYEQKEQAVTSEVMRELERVVSLRVLDQKWIEHLDAMDDLRDGIGLRAYGQRDPLVEYKVEAYDMFQEMTYAIQEDIVRFVFQIQVVAEQPQPQQPVVIVAPPPPPIPLDLSSIGRNDPCPCGSGKKFKRCHGIEKGA